MLILQKRVEPMALKDYALKKSKPKKRPIGRILVSMVLVILIVGAAAFYLSRGVSTTTIYCGVFQYLEFGADSVVGTSTENVTETMTTAVSYTTTTDIPAKVGYISSTTTSTTDQDGYPAGVATVCKYISTSSTSTSSSST
jgi:hypothetical protein